MKIILPLLIASITVLGCSKYQYAVMSSSTSVDSVGLTIRENDSLRITYAFSGIHGQAYLQIYNKLNVPLYINWSKSGVILSDQVASEIKENTIAINKEPSDRKKNSPNIIRWHREMSSNPDSVEHTWSQAVTAIPAKSNVKSDVIYLGNKFFLGSSSGMKKDRQGRSEVKYRTYSRSESPFQFQSHLIVSPSDNFSDSTVMADDFWVSEISVTGVKPSEMGPRFNKANVYFTKKPTIATEVAVSALILGLVGFLTANQILAD